jgi:hypothetical protein
VEGTHRRHRALDYNNGVGGNWGTAASNWVWGSVTSDDAYKGSEATDQPNITDIELYNWTTGAADTYLNEKWSSSYEGVVRANSTIALNRSGKKPEEIPRRPEVSGRSPVPAGILLRSLEDVGQVLLHRGMKTSARPTWARCHRDILGDLDGAIGLLPASQNDVGRVTSTAKAYKESPDVPAVMRSRHDLADVRGGPYDWRRTSAGWTNFRTFPTAGNHLRLRPPRRAQGNNANYGSA